MKNLIHLLRALMSLALMGLICIAGTTDSMAQADLKVSQITTPGGWKVGYCNKLKVMVTNSQSTGVSQNIPVLVTISFGPGTQAISLVGETSSGIGPNDHYGQPVWFHDVYIPSGSRAKVVATVNPDSEIEETTHGNNQKLKENIRIVGHCGSSQPVTGGGGTGNGGQTTKKANSLTVMVNKKSSQLRSRSSRSSGVAGAMVVVKYKGKSKKLNTDRSGKAMFKNIPAGYCEIIVQKGKCKRKKKYKMQARSSKYGFALDCL